MRESLLELRAAGTEVPLVAGIEDVQDHFPGPRSDYLPDLSVRWTRMEPVMEARSDRLGTIRAHFGTGRSGNHHAPAFAVVMAPARDAAAFGGLKHTADLAGGVFRCLAPQSQHVGFSRQIH